MTVGQILVVVFNLTSIVIVCSWVAVRWPASRPWLTLCFLAALVWAIVDPSTWVEPFLWGAAALAVHLSPRLALIVRRR